MTINTKSKRDVYHVDNEIEYLKRACECPETMWLDVGVDVGDFVLDPFVVCDPCDMFT